MEEQRLYDQYKEGKHWKNHPTAYAEQFAMFLKDHEFNGLLVDVGSGTGRDVHVFHKEGFDVIGVDISEEEIMLARTQFPSCTFEQQNAENLQFDTNSISAFFVINLIHWVNKEKTLQELWKALKPQGYLFIHFNISITDENGHIDYSHDKKDIMNLISLFELIKKRIFERIDSQPKKHTHKIMELILQKK